jgi:GT2 family glycosyltransferase
MTTAIPDVSVCIVNWNCRELLRDCLASLLERSQGASVEVIVVDNASADGAADMVAERFPGVTLVRNARNEGFARGNNRAAALARGRYLFFLNNDTVVPADTLRRLVAYAEAHPEVGMIGPRLRDGTGRVQVSYRPLPTLSALLHRVRILRSTGLFHRAYGRFRRKSFDPDRECRVETLMGAAMFLPRRVFDECGPWDEDFVFGAEDLHFSACIGRRYPLVFLPEIEITHFGGVSTRQHSGYVSANQAAGMVRFLRKSGYSRAALWGYKLAVTLDIPVQFAGKGVEYVATRLRGRRAKADRVLIAWRGAGHFLTRGLVPFWKA